MRSDLEQAVAEMQEAGKIDRRWIVRGATLAVIFLAASFWWIAHSHGQLMDEQKTLLIEPGEDR